MTDVHADRYRPPIPWPLVLLALACLMIATATRAQVVHIGNYSGSEFDGWKRSTVDVMPPAKAGRVGDVSYVLGRCIGADARVVDLRLRLEPGELRSIDLRKADAAEFDLGPLPANPLAFFGQPSIAGVPFSIVDAKPDGAAWLAHLRARTGPMLCTDLWVTWYPDQPSWATGEAVVTASNPSVPDLVATAPEDFRLRFGAADVVVPGLPMAPPRLGMVDRGATAPDGSVVERHRSDAPVLGLRDNLAQRPGRRAHVDDRSAQPAVDRVAHRSPASVDRVATQYGRASDGLDAMCDMQQDLAHLVRRDTASWLAAVALPASVSLAAEDIQDAGDASLAGHRFSLGLGAPWPRGAGREYSLATGGSRQDLARLVNHLAYNSPDEKEPIRTAGLRATDFFGTGRIGTNPGGARPSNRGAEAGHLSTGVRRSPAGGASAAVDRAGARSDDGLATEDGGGAVLLPAGTVIGDGQARSFPLVFIWRQHLTSEREWSSAGAAASLSICANGVAKLWPDGNPQPIADPLGWTRANWAGAIARLHSWDDGPLGVKKRSGDTGKQEDQVFVGGECCSGPASLGAETVRYLVALGQSKRPCHHLEAGGALLDLARHPKLVIWSGRAHWHTGVSQDQIGKPRALTEIESHGWSGPDREHWLENTVAIAYRLTGSPALQWQIEAQARLFLLQETVDPRLSTSDFSAERAIGWAGIVAVHLWRSLEDRALAEQVAQRWRDRVLKVYLPRLGRKPQDVWKPITDSRLVADTGWRPLNWMPYQQAIGAYGLDFACRLLGPPEGRDLAVRGARAAMRAWEPQPDGRWKPWSYWGFSTEVDVPFIEGHGAATGPNVWVWFAPAAWMLRAEKPEVWQQVRREADPKWLPVEADR